MTSQPGKQTIAIHVLSNISRSKRNQAMKFGQLKFDFHLALTRVNSSYFFGVNFQVQG